MEPSGRGRKAGALQLNPVEPHTTVGGGGFWARVAYWHGTICQIWPIWHNRKTTTMWCNHDIKMWFTLSKVVVQSSRTINANSPESFARRMPLKTHHSFIAQSFHCAMNVSPSYLSKVAWRYHRSIISQQCYQGQVSSSVFSLWALCYQG